MIDTKSVAVWSEEIIRCGVEDIAETMREDYNLGQKSWKDKRFFVQY